MVLAYHLIVSAYGFWMPNEACGSWSRFVRSYSLWLAGGDATTVHTRRSVAHLRRDHDHGARLRAVLKREPVRFTDDQRNAIAAGFADYCRRTGCVLHACAILRDHAHLVVARHRITIERTCDQLKAAATAELHRRGLHPFADAPLSRGRLPSPWARKGWWVYLDSADDIRRATRYTDDNPIKAGLPPQRWGFVTAYGGGGEPPVATGG